MSKVASSSRSKRTNPLAIDRDKLKEVARSVHPGVPLHQRIEIILDQLIDELADQLEGK